MLQKEKKIQLIWQVLDLLFQVLIPSKLNWHLTVTASKAWMRDSLIDESIYLLNLNIKWNMYKKEKTREMTTKSPSIQKCNYFFIIIFINLKIRSKNWDAAVVDVSLFCPSPNRPLPRSPLRHVRAIRQTSSSGIKLKNIFEEIVAQIHHPVFLIKRQITFLKP